MSQHLANMGPTITVGSAARYVGDLVNSPYGRCLSGAGASPNASDEDLSLGKKKKENKIGRTFSPFGRARRKLSIRPPPQVSISWSVETPPILFFGDPANCAGALITGQMFLNADEPLDIDSFEAVLELRIVRKKPFHKDCPDCASQVTLLNKWPLVPQPTSVGVGKHAYPFSTLLNGNLPASVDNNLLSIVYEFKAQAVFQGVPVTFERRLPVKRTLVMADPEHQSQRVFPPTNITVSMFLNRVIYPQGKHGVHLRIDGLVSRVDDGIETWKLKKATWRLEEACHTIAPACSKHAPKDEPNKAYLRKEKRNIGDAVLYSGWKADYSGMDSSVQFEFEYSIARQHPREIGGYTCDFLAKDGTTVTHTLYLELLLLKEYASNEQPRAGQPTSDARVLRMKHSIVITDDPGLGMSWDEEVPPIYEEVPPSPPKYPQGEAPTEFELLELPDEGTRSSTDSGVEIYGHSPPR